MLQVESSDKVCEIGDAPGSFKSTAWKHYVSFCPTKKKGEKETERLKNNMHTQCLTVC